MTTKEARVIVEAMFKGIYDPNPTPMALSQVAMVVTDINRDLATKTSPRPVSANHMVNAYAESKKARGIE